MNFEVDFEVILRKEVWRTINYCSGELSHRLDGWAKEEIEDKNRAKEGSLNFSKPQKRLLFLLEPYKKFTQDLLHYESSEV